MSFSFQVQIYFLSLLKSFCNTNKLEIVELQLQLDELKEEERVNLLNLSGLWSKNTSEAEKQRYPEV